VVIDDWEEAARLVAEGRAVVLLVDADPPRVGLVDADPPRVGSMPTGPGRLALFVGSRSDPAAWEAARAMAAELFGST
jgi:hypothetical protein